MSAKFKLTHAYPDCPTCGGQVDAVKHESIDEDRVLDTAHAIHSKGLPLMLQPCGHEMHGFNIQDLGESYAKITDWLARASSRLLTGSGA